MVVPCRRTAARGKTPAVMLAERSLPGSLIVDQTGSGSPTKPPTTCPSDRRVLELERSGNPVDSMWIIFDQQYRNSYVFAAERVSAHASSADVV